ncbi:MAG: hypothetical protein C4522_10390 [Desulfobacteraceae bacterium]|nr:MAG: hypothetical protein C4522_10390 [Desulfobacteraceae bacterium]
MVDRFERLREAQAEGIDAKVIVRGFVSMPFDPQWDDVWFKGIQVCADKLNDYQLEFKRADREPYIERNLEFNVLRKIDQTELLVADVSPVQGSSLPNPSVMHEIGYAVGKELPVILIGLKNSHKSLPANLKGSILIEYELNKLDKFIGEFTSQIQKTITKEIASKRKGDFVAQSFSNRNRINIPGLIVQAKQRVQMITTNLQFVFTNLKDSIDQALDSNRDNPEFKVEILTMDPEGDTTNARAAQLGQRTRQYRDILRESLDNMRKAYDGNSKVEIVTYSSLPTQITYIIDETVITSVISFGQLARRNIHFVVEANRPKVSESFLAHFSSVKALAVLGKTS